MRQDIAGAVTSGWRRLFRVEAFCCLDLFHSFSALWKYIYIQGIPAPSVLLQTI
jgi:hypothetical protein